MKVVAHEARICITRGEYPRFLDRDLIILKLYDMHDHDL